jgi:hypothetical protein
MGILVGWRQRLFRLGYCKRTSKRRRYGPSRQALIWLPRSSQRSFLLCVVPKFTRRVPQIVAGQRPLKAAASGLA